MLDFVPTIRTDRKREIAEYEKRKYTFIDKVKYEFIEQIKFNDTDILYEYGVRVDLREVKFYIMKDGSNLYFTIYEIYEILNSISKEYDRSDVIQLLKDYINETEETYFLYRDIEYSIRKIPRIIDKKIEIYNLNLEITYTEFFFLIFLIQEKSNYLFYISQDKKDYKDGILRLLIVLLSRKEDNWLLLLMGWKYSPEEGKYIKFENEINENKRSRLKYYLTEIEMNTIIETES